MRINSCPSAAAGAAASDTHYRFLPAWSLVRLHLGKRKFVELTNECSGQTQQVVHFGRHDD